MGTGFTEIVRKSFEKGDPITLIELYDMISKNPDAKVDPDKLKHRVRSSIYSLQKSKEIIRVGGTTYQKVSKKKNL